MVNKRNLSTNRDDVLEQWLNAELGSDYHENSDSGRDTANSRSDNEFSDNDEDFVLESDHDSNSEISGNEDECEERETSNLPEYYYGKNRFKWAKSGLQYMFVRT